MLSSITDLHVLLYLIAEMGSDNHHKSYKLCMQVNYSNKNEQYLKCRGFGSGPTLPKIPPI